VFAGVLVDFGLYSITLRELSQPQADEPRILGNAVALRIAATSCAILLLVLGLATAGVSATGVMIAGAGWVALQLSELLRAVFQLKLAQHPSTLAEVVGAAATLMLVVALSGLHAETDSMLAATAAGFCCAAAVSWRALILAGLPIGGSLIFQTIQLRVDVAFLALLRSPAELGLYDAPLKLYELLFAVPLLFGGLMLPLYVRDVGHRAGSVAPRLNAALGVSFIFSMLTFAVLAECAGPIVVMFAGPGFGGSADPLRILAGSAIFAGVTGTLRFAAVAVD
jgi:O-antigen/teichoic acid export membrane protein